MYSFDEVLNYDPEVAKAMEDELTRQRTHIELIASENLVSKAVMAAMGSPLTNKYAEGYPGKRYYGGCEYVDVVETLAIERAKKLFGCEYANVQPHSGAQANLAAFFAMVEPGDTVMGMSLDCGGHLSHGSPVNISGKYFNIVPYGVTAEGFIDYDEVLRIAKECKPKMIIAGASAYARVIDFKKFREIADEVGAYLMVDMAHIAGLVAGGEHPSPIPYADVVTTTTHKTLRGPRGGMILSRDMISTAIVRIFSKDAEVVGMAADFLSVMAFWCFTNGVYNTTSGLFQGTGHTEVTMAIDVTRLWVFRFLTLWFCESVLHMGVRSVWYSVVISNGISALILYVLYRCGIWKKTRIKVGKEEATKGVLWRIRNPIRKVFEFI